MFGLLKLQNYRFTRVYGNFLNGDFVASRSTKLYDVLNPVTQ